MKYQKLLNSIVTCYNHSIIPPLRTSYIFHFYAVAVVAVV